MKEILCELSKKMSVFGLEIIIIVEITKFIYFHHFCVDVKQ